MAAARVPTGLMTGKRRDRLRPGHGISEVLIGLSIVAIGTSAPELATTIVTTLQDERDVAVGIPQGGSIRGAFVAIYLTYMFPLITIRA